MRGLRKVSDQTGVMESPIEKDGVQLGWEPVGRYEIQTKRPWGDLKVLLEGRQEADVYL